VKFEERKYFIGVRCLVRFWVQFVNFSISQFSSSPHRFFAHSPHRALRSEASAKEESRFLTPSVSPPQRRGDIFPEASGKIVGKLCANFCFELFSIQAFIHSFHRAIKFVSSLCQDF
jgi:hypothetical protein